VNNIGYVGTLSPFTKEMVAVGIDEQFVYNLPIFVQLKSQHGIYKVKIAQSSYVKQSDRNVDLLVYHIKPFTVVKPLEFFDFTPLTCHADVKYIQSDSPRKISMRKLGKGLGLDLRYIVETESPILDAKAQMDQLALFDFSLKNMFLFGWTNTALTKEGMPSVRYHQLSLFYSPADSQTSEAQIQIGWLKSSKKEADDGIHTRNLLLNNTVSSDMYKKMQGIIQKINLSHWNLVILQFNLVLNGPEPTNVLLTAGAVQGLKQGENHFACHVQERVNFVKKREFCTAGFVLLPDDQGNNVGLSLGHSIKFVNNLGFGTDCNQFHLKIFGSTSLSEEYLKKALNSKESKQCAQTLVDLAILRKELMEARISALEAWKIQTIEESLLRKSVKHYAACKQQYEQLKMLDKVSFHVEHNLEFPSHILHRLGWLELKEMLIPYQTSLSEIPSGDNINIDMQYNPAFNAITMSLASAETNATFENIRLPNYFRNILPWSAARGPAEHIFQRLTGMSSYETCWLADGAVTTFGNQSYLYTADDCYHVLAADCTGELSYAVLLRELDGQKHLQVMYGSSEIRLRPSHGRPEINNDYLVTIDGQDVKINQVVEFHLKDGKTKITISRYGYFLSMKTFWAGMK